MEKINRLYKKFLRVRIQGEEETKEFQLVYKLLGETTWDDPGMSKYPHYVYQIAVRRGDVPSDIYTFEYHSSHMQWRQRQKKLSDRELVEAFKMTIEDALAYLNHADIDEFAKEFGYSSIKGLIKTWKACQKAYEEIKEKLKLTDNDLYELSEILTDWENENYKHPKVSVARIRGEVWEKEFKDLAGALE